MALKGKKDSSETRERKRIANTGKNKGRKHTKKARKNMSNGQKGRHFSNEHKRKISLANSGAKCHWWKGGISKEYKKRYHDVEYKIWRISVFERDNYTCQNCRRRGIYITAHHIKSWAHYPSLRYDVNNGVALCEECHSLTDNYKGRNKKK